MGWPHKGMSSLAVSGASGRNGLQMGLRNADNPPTGGRVCVCMWWGGPALSLHPMHQHGDRPCQASSRPRSHEPPGLPLLG